MAFQRARAGSPTYILTHVRSAASSVRRHKVFSGALLLCASGLVLGTAAQASPVEYVKVCSLYGAQFYYVAGTDKCGYAGGAPFREETAYGTITNTPGLNSTAYGDRSFAYGDQSLAIGNDAWAGGDPTSASPGAGYYGYNGTVPGSAFFNAGTTAIGEYARAGAGAVGQTNATAVGESATANAVGASAFGQASNAAGDYSTAYGMSAAATGNYSVAAGTYASVSAASGAAFGYGATVSASNAVALGANSVADTANTISVGSAGNERRIVNVAAGTLSATSTDAVTGSQLYDTNLSVATNAANIASNTTAISNLNLDVGNINATLSGVASAKYLQVASTGAAASATGTNAIAIGGSASATRDGAIAVGYGASSTGTNAIAIGTGASATGSVAVGNSASAANGGAAFGDQSVATGSSSAALGAGAQATAANATAIGAGSIASDANTVSVGSSGNERRITNVAPGVAATDAVNFDQYRQGLSGVHKQMGRVGALGAAMAQMVAGASNIPTTNRISMGFGTYDGESGIAVGYQRTVADHVNVTLGAAVSGGDTSAGAGIGFGW